MDRRAVLGALAVALAASVGCSGAESAAPPEPGVTVRLVIPDGNLRPPDVPCAGAGGFRYAHPEAPYAIESPAGKVVASGDLPQGTAEQAWNVDLGDRPQPTVCVMTLEVSGLDSVAGHTLAIDGHRPNPIRPNRTLDDIPEVVLR